MSKKATYRKRQKIVYSNVRGGKNSLGKYEKRNKKEEVSSDKGYQNLAISIGSFACVIAINACPDEKVKILLLGAMIILTALRLDM